MNSRKSLISHVTKQLTDRHFEQDEENKYQLMLVSTLPGGTVTINGRVSRSPDSKVYGKVEVELLGPGQVISEDRTEDFELIRFAIFRSPDNAHWSQPFEVTSNVYYDDLSDFEEYLQEYFNL